MAQRMMITLVQSEDKNVSRELLHQLYIQKGLSQTQVADRLGVSLSYVKKLLRQYQIKKVTSKHRKKASRTERKRKWTMATYILVLEDVMKGKNLSEIAKFYDREEEEIKNHIEKAVETGFIKRIPKPYQYIKKYSGIIS